MTVNRKLTILTECGMPRENDRGAAIRGLQQQEAGVSQDVGLH